MFLKTLLDTLFVGGIEANVSNSNNTILDDDSPKKSVYNDTGNWIFLQIWTQQAINDDFYLSALASMLFYLHSGCNLEQLRDFVNEFQIEVPPLAKDSKLHLHIASEMALSTRNVGI
jgi:hypothetical protein